MSYNYAIDGQLLEMEAEAEKLRARFQKELAERITSHTKKFVDIERSQINTLKKELSRIRKFLEDQPECSCKPVICKTCGRILKNRHTYNQHLRTTH